MKKITLAGILAGLILFVGTIGAGLFYVSAQSRSGEFKPPFARGGDHEEMMRRMFDRIADRLKLTDEQRAQTRQTLADTKTRVEPLTEQLKANHGEIKQLGRDGKYDAAAAERLAAAQADLIKQMIVEKEKTKAALFAILTPEQRAEAAKLMDQFGERMRGAHKPPMF